ncbi:MAG: hypothetical protein ACT4R6_01120 [Gemmatimonadaceae bacterium]
MARISPVPQRLISLVYGYRPALALAFSQRVGGTWNDAMLSLPSARAQSFDGVGTIVAYRRLLEYGWESEAPPLAHARRVLFRLLAEDNDPSLLYELAGKGHSDAAVVRRHRALLREAAACALAQAGYERDPRLRGAALRLLHRVVVYVQSPIAADPWVTSGGKRALAGEAAPPSVFFLAMLAHMPLFRFEHAGEVDDIMGHLTSGPAVPDPGQMIGRHLMSQPHVVTGDPLAAGARDNVSHTLGWLELFARLGFLKRHAPWSNALDALLQGCDASGVWRPAKRGGNADPTFWAAFPLESGAPDDGVVDITFRLSLIARLTGRALEFV